MWLSIRNKVLLKRYHHILDFFTLTILKLLDWYYTRLQSLLFVQFRKMFTTAIQLWYCDLLNRKILCCDVLYHTLAIPSSYRGMFWTSLGFFLPLCDPVPYINHTESASWDSEALHHGRQCSGDVVDILVWVLGGRTDKLKPEWIYAGLLCSYKCSPLPLS